MACLLSRGFSSNSSPVVGARRSGCRHDLLHHCGEASRRATWLDMVLTLDMAGEKSTVGTQLLAAGHGVRLRAFCALPNVVGGSEIK